MHDLAAVHYHAGLEPEERSAAQEAFIEGRIQTVVATTAFGMGIDKPDIRLVALYNYPESLESYVQMVGRAGRDGRASDTLLLASRADAQQLRRFARSDIPTVADLRAVYARLRGRGEVAPESWQLAAASPTRASSSGCSSRSGSSGAASTPAGRCRSRCPSRPPTPPQRIDLLLARYEQEALARADRLVRFAESRRCRHRQVAEHFGETLPEDCGMCDVCSPLAMAAVGGDRRPPRCRTTSRARSTVRCSTCAGRSGGPASPRCCADR